MSIPQLRLHPLGRPIAGGFFKGVCFSTPADGSEFFQDSKWKRTFDNRYDRYSFVNYPKATYTI
jgi:hypothetical protein